MKKSLKKLIFTNFNNILQRTKKWIYKYFSRFRDTHFREHVSVAVFIMRVTLSRLPKKAIVEIFKKSAKNAWVAFKQLLVQSYNRNSTARYEITVKTPDGSTLRTDFNSWFCVFIVDIGQLIWAVSGFFEVLLLVILDRYFAMFVILNFWVRTGKCRLLGKLEKIFHNCHKPLLTRINIQNVCFGECLPD